MTLLRWFRNLLTTTTGGDKPMRCILPYKTGSKGANDLAAAMNIPLVGRDIDLRRGGQHITVINWGCGNDKPVLANCRVLNPPSAVMKAINKLTTFQVLQRANVRTPEFTTSQATAQRWLANRTRVCARTELEGRDGAGLTVVGPTDGWTAPVLPRASLYTKFIPARAEYRVNVANGETVGVQLKVHDPNKRTTSEQVRTGGNGWAFRLLDEREIPRGIRPPAREAIRALGLTFGGVDLIVGQDGNTYILEVNTAPELTPAMVRGYAQKLANA